ncbi:MULTISPECIES: hypothetical protein [unclassified Mycoplasma]|uniref:hypothetical protein n=1 Tax=unclassified Mycoplasma TaxID=2683645 RepID=UPI00211BF4C2|nr:MULTISPECIES: hypothetical protein [unclassified Mycoplasma]UUM19611.1 hypothetical protein NPA11_02435 [Mycoplasma sp. 1578d]UUM24581.1 hypothetical protein NPA12_02665 [Mycoplasma sp. 3686d]
MKNKLNKWALLLASIATPAFVALSCQSAQSSSEHKEDGTNAPIATPGAPGKTNENQPINNNPDVNIANPSQNTESDITNPDSDLELTNSSIITQEPFVTKNVEKDGVVRGTLKLERIGWNKGTKISDFIKELKNVSLDYEQRIHSVKSIQLLRKFFIRSNYNSYVPVETNPPVVLKTMTKYTPTGGKEEPSTPISIWVPYNFEFDQPLDESKLSPTQKKAKDQLLDLRATIIKSFFSIIRAVGNVPQHYNFITGLQERENIAFQLDVSSLIFTIDYLLNHNVFDLYINSILQGKLLLDKTGKPSEPLTNKFFDKQFNLLPSDEAISPYAFAFSFLYLKRKATNILDLARRS